MCLQGKPLPLDGYSTIESVLPLRVASILGCKTVLTTSCVGGIPNLRSITKFETKASIGDIVLVTDHIFLGGMAGLGWTIS